MPSPFITTPLKSAAQKTEHGIRMAIAKAGQSAFDMFGEEAILSEEFLSKDFRTWEAGLVSINHGNNNDLLNKATISDLEYDSESKLVWATFNGLPDKAIELVNSEFYEGVSQECIPLEFKGNKVFKGYGIGATIVTYPYKPAATPDQGVGVRPTASMFAAVALKYPSEDAMTENKGGGTPAVSIEAFESTVSENVQLKSTIGVLESDNKKKDDEIASWKQKYSELEAGEADRTKIAISEARKSWDAELKATAEREEAISELKTAMSKEAAENYLATNPTIEQIKSIAGIMKDSASKKMGSSMGSASGEEGKSYEQLDSEWKAKLGRA